MATNPFNRELSLQEHELNINGQCISCHGHVEPDVEYDVWDDYDGNIHADPCGLSYPRFCPGCHETITLICIETGVIKPKTQAEIDADNDLPF